jgi:hypothetical protein
VTQFKLTPDKVSKAKSTRKEKYGVREVLNYLDLLVRQRVPIAYWVNEEFPGPYNRSHPRRKRASDIIGIFKGRLLCFEMKTEKDYHLIINHWEQIKINKGQQNEKYEHYRDQIEFIELVNLHGGLAMMAFDWRQVRDRLVQEGIDTTNMIIAGDKMQ